MSVTLALKILYFFADLVLPLTVGSGVQRWSGVRPGAFDRLTEATIVGLVPVLTTLSFWGLTLRVELLWLPVVGMAMQAAAGLVALARLRTKQRNPLDAGAYLFSAMLSNRGVVGSLSVFILFGERGYAWSRMVLLFGVFVLFLLCFPLARRLSDVHHFGEGGVRSGRRGFLSPRQMPMVGIAVGAALNLAGVDRPAALSTAFPWLVHLNAWLLLLPIGASLDFGEMRRHWREIPDLLAIKFLITPLITWGLAAAVGLRDPMLVTAVILAASPTAIMAVVVCKLHGLNVHLATTAFVVTTAAYVAVGFPLVLGILWMVGRL